MSQPFLGQIALFPYNFAPYGWIECAGQILSIAQNTALFSLLGTNYGGNGTSNFALPNLQGRVGVNQGNGPGLSPYLVGEEVGVETVTLAANQSAAHNHSLNATTTRGNANTPGGNVLATGESGSGRNVNTASIYNPANPKTTLVAPSIAPAGSAQPLAHNNIQPYLVLRPCIALSGIFPTRG